MDQLMSLHPRRIVLDHQTTFKHFPFDIAFIQVVIQY